MKQFILKTLKVIYNFQPMANYYPHATTWKMCKWKLARTCRNVSIVVMFITTGVVSAKGYYYLHPNLVHAEPITNIVTVPADLTIEDFPMLVKICNAESGGKQFKANGDVMRGYVNSSDVGRCQINEAINNDQARRLGFDIFTEKGNVQMAIWMYVRQGTDPWKSSMCIKGGWGTKAQCSK